MRSMRRNSWKSDILGLSKTTSHDSCLDHIDETNNCTGSVTGRKQQCYSMPACEHAKRRATIMSTSPGSSLLEISKSENSGSKKFMSFLHRGFHGHKSKSSTKLEKEKNKNTLTKDKSNHNNLEDVIPIPIRETAFQGHSRTLFHKVPNSNLRAKPLIILADDTKVVPIHSSILSNKFHHCVKILSISPNVYRDSEEHQYELMLPTGTRSLGHTCRIMVDDSERYRSCNSSQTSLFTTCQTQKPTVGYVFSCASSYEQKKWISVLTRVARPNQQNERRKEISLNLWIQEAKNVPPKKRYFCEIYLDGALYARTTTKMMGDMLFWGEEFNLCNLDEVNVVALLLWKSADEGRSKRKKSQQQLVCQINISTKEVDQRTSVEKWYSASSNYNPSSPDTPTSYINQGILSSANTAFVPISQSVQITNIVNSSTNLGSIDQVPMLRVKARYLHLDVLPLSAYTDLTKFLNDNAVRILTDIEPYLKVKAKEDLAQNFIQIIHKQGTAVPILCDLVINEINKSDDKNLILRGNTMASKAMEIYLKLIGEKYLQLTLSDFINRVLLGLDDCEVDPQKDKFDFYCGSSGGHYSPGVEKNTPHYCLQQRQESLLMNVEMIWAKIMSSSIYFPKDLKAVFVTLRQRLRGPKTCQSYSQVEDQPDLCDRIISACIFLRYICPAILTPSLFGLIPEYPDNPRVTRTFTLVAKCIQTLANFSNLSGTKETYMVFMNNFIENNFKTMSHFLREISEKTETDSVRKETKSECPTPSSIDSKEYLYWENLSTNLPEDTIDSALCLSTLHRQLEDCLQLIEPRNYSANIKALHGILEDLNHKLKSKVEMPPGMKISHSYQNIRLQAQYNHEHAKRISLDTPDYRSRRNSNDVTEQKSVLWNSKPITTKEQFIRSTNNSHSAESTPTHQLLDKSVASAEYLMTQSMIENSLPGSKILKPIQPSSQVDKDWQAMLSASYAYNSKPKDTFFADPSTTDQENKSSTSSGYQTLSRSTDSINNVKDDSVILLKSPTTSLKPSVKKCKQARRQTEIIPRSETFNSAQQFNMKSRIKESSNRSISSEEIRQMLIRNPLFRQEESLDTCSTQTLTSANVTTHESDPATVERRQLLNSISMPAVHSVFDIDTNTTSAFSEGQHCDAHLKMSSADGMSTSCHSKSAFRETLKSKQQSHSTKNSSAQSITADDTEKIKYSLNSLRHTLNSRMKQLLLADRTTIQLELERVRLMRQICDSSTTNSTTLANTVVVFGEHESQNMNSINDNVSTPAPNSHHVKTLTVRKYLDQAENVLSEAFRNHSKADRNKINSMEKEMEDLLVQIFQTNQNLQNTLMSKSDTIGPSDVVIPRYSNEPGIVNGISNHSSLNNRANRSTFNKSTVDNGKSNSLGSLVTNLSSGAMIEIVDAV